MFRCVLSLVLALQLIAPPRAVLWLLPIIVPAAKSAEEQVKGIAKICPCTGKVGCNCCGCAEEKPEDPTPTSDEDGVPKPPATEGSGICVGDRCTCAPSDQLLAGAAFLPSIGKVHVDRPEPLVIEWLRFDSDICNSLVLPLDSPPPRTFS